MPSGLICEKCTEKIIHCYTFIENTKKLFKIIEHCVTDINSKALDISHELDDSKEYYDANVMIVVEYDAQTYNEIDELTSVQNVILSDIPLKSKIMVENFTPVITNVTSVDTKKEIDKMIHDAKKDFQTPNIMPTQRVVKYPRIVKQIVTRKENNTKPENDVQVKVANDKSETNVTPNVLLKNGKLLIEPLHLTSGPVIPKFNTYNCPTCCDIFTSYRKMKEHEKAKHSAVIYQCRLCDKCYNTQQYLDMHYKALHLKERCRFCSELFSTDDGSLDEHLSENHKNSVSACPFCNLVYYNPEELETHIKSTHICTEKLITNNKTQCIMCLRGFVDDQLVNHKCKFACLDCPVVQEKCIHYDYLMSYREQVLNHASTIKCIDCDYTTKRKELFLCHVNREHLDHHPFTCGDCGTQFYTKQSLKTHIIQFHLEYKCEFCDTDFNKNPKHYQSHREICKSVTRQFACDQCVASFDTKEELGKHSALNHTEFVYPCPSCKKEFPDEISLGEHHNKIHSGVQMKKRRKFIECTLCDVNFKNLKEMVEHEKSHDTSETFPCKVCPKEFKTLRQVYVHKQRHYTERTQCTGCGKAIIVSRLKQHKENCKFIKNCDIKHICEHCGKEFHSDQTLKIHQRIHSKPVSCDYCNKMLKPDCLKAHIKKLHPAAYNFDEPPINATKTILNKEPKIKEFHNCDKCEYSTKSRLSLDNHINRVHLKIKPFTCTFCNKSFCGKIRLLEHLKTHSENNSCFCSYCGKKYANKVCLKMHVRRHTGEYPYKCNICFEKFRSSSIMKTHRLKKHQDKTICCPLCGSMFHLATEMRFHVKKAHWTRKEPFDFRQIVPAEHHHLFEDRRLQKLGEENDGIAL